VYPSGQNDTLETWFTDNLRTNPSGGFLANRTGEEFVKFVNRTPAGQSDGLADSRFSMATPQYLAAGSYGALHATLKDWGWPDKVPYLDQVFPLLSRCLHQLRPPDNNDPLETKKANQESLVLGVISHGWAEQRKVRSAPCQPGKINCFECSVRQCDQIDWQRRWSKIMAWYSTGGRGYRLGPDEISDIVHSGTVNYDPR
jgi:hypothetical protein